MEKLIHRFKTDMKLAIRTVKSGWKTYFAVFIAIFLIQMLFGIIGFARANSLESERATILSKYDSHIELTYLNDADHYYLMEAANAKMDPYYAVIPYSMDGSYHTTGIYFYGDVEDGLATFLLEFAEMFENGTIYTETPLYDYDAAGIGDSVRYAFLLVFVGAISFVLLTILNNIRINHFKFDYGIYMSFGADFKRLAGSTLCETMYILVLTYLPAMLCAFLLVAGLSLAAGGSIVFTLMPLVWAFFIPAVVAVLATVFPIRWLTLRRPSNVMLAADNANHVISPRRSRMIFATRFPHVPEMLALTRFSGYGLRLVLAGTLFSLLFTCGIYAITYYDGTLNCPSAQYTLNLVVPDSEFIQQIDAMEGVTVLNGAETDAVGVISHVLFSEDTVKRSEGFMQYPYDNTLLATHHIVYRAADNALPAALTEHYGYEITGDPAKVLEDPYSVIISDSVSSRKVLDIEPGDTVYIAVGSDQSERFDGNAIYSNEELLRVHLENFTFMYRAFTVAAVIRNEPNREGICVYLPSQVYSELTDTAPTVWSVYTDPELSDAEFESIDTRLRSMAAEQGASVRDHEARTLQELDRSHNFTAVYTAVFCIVLALLPLIWFFSLILFNEKRRGEMDVYRALGATDKELSRLYVIDGIVYALIGVVTYAVAAPVCTYYLQGVLTSSEFFIFFLQSYADKPVYLSVMPDLWAYLAGILLTALSAFLASYCSYRIYHKRESEHISENFSEEV